MYCNFFEFSEKPFDVTPDPKFLYLTPSHREALSALMYGICERKGFIVLVGDVGSGKTTLLNALLNRLDEKTHVAFIFNTNITFEQMLDKTLVDLGLARPNKLPPKSEAVRRLNEFAIRQMSRGGNVVLLVDEAQNLDRPTMENLRLLSNLETFKYKLIQIVLSGQSELDGQLSRPELRQLAQRISIKRYITPLGEEETYQYLGHRLRLAGYSGPPLFDRNAQQLIWEYSEGVPRKINVLCDNALLIGYAMREKIIKSNVVIEAINDLTWNPFSEFGETQTPPSIQRTPFSERRTFSYRFAMVASLIILASIVFLGGVLVGRSRLSYFETKPIPIKASARAEIETREDYSGQSLPVRPLFHEQRETSQNVTLFRVPQENFQRTPTPSVGKPSKHLKSDDESTSMAQQTSRVSQESSTSKLPGPSARNNRVVVKKGDSLFKIIIQAYGRYDRAILNAVLGENPEIQRPEYIMVGQVIKLPEE